VSNKGVVVFETQKIPRREEIPVEHTWDLTTMYADDEAWEHDLTWLEQMLPEVGALQGTLGLSAQALLGVFELCNRISMTVERVYTYAICRHASDNTDAQAQMLVERAEMLVTQINAAVAFIEPEILAVPADRIAAWLDEEPALLIYNYRLEELVRQRTHVCTAEVEALLAEAEDITRTASTIFGVLTEADMSFGLIEDESGKLTQFSWARYRRFMESNDRRVRRDAFKILYQGYGALRNTFATTLASEIRTHIFYARTRNYDSCLRAALEPDDIPISVYTNLVATVDRSLPRLHRYMRLSKRLLELDELRAYDLFAPLVPEIDVVTTYEQAKATIQRALAPLGPAYAAALQHLFRNRHIDIYENAGKSTGACTYSAYTTEPFILLNFQDRLRDMFTLSHELGHAVHSSFARQAQPYIYGSYTSFVAEIASILNETLLTDYLLKTSFEPTLRKHLAAQQLKNIYMKLFRQTMFAAFELDIHQRMEAGEVLTADHLCELYRMLVARYHGPDVALDDDIALEWTRIPHFYPGFYVYQYATGMAAALALAKQILTEGQPAVDRYLRFLKSGSSRSSIDLLRDLGVDMTKAEPILQSLDTFDTLLDELEAFI
jgi:oligoendopeptidase F